LSTTLGDIEITPLVDAVGVLGDLGELYAGAPADEWEPYRALYPEVFDGSGWRLLVAVYLLRSGGKTLLLDTGVGPAELWQEWKAEREGLLPGALEALGLGPADVDVVFLTHLHIDHLGWNADADAAVFFPNARYVVHADALAYANSKADRPQIRRCVTPLLDRFEDAVEGAELLRGVTPVMFPGHYPGHMGLRIRSGGTEAVAIGDIAPHPALLDRTEWVFAFDEVPQTSTRAELVREVVDTDVVVICGHYPGSGIGRVVTRDGRVTWEELA
jgi:glyoxylase-like metal-dependent hydrolase (beta-lactamase superfamily II)